jgi:hypothetical protein
MLSPCLFVVLLALGYFLIDKKTKTELISKCKKNKFMILGGIIFIYYFFLQNNVEGITVEDYHGDQDMRKDFTNFSIKFCWPPSDDTVGLGKSHWGSDSDKWPKKGGGSDCHSAMMRFASNGEILERLEYNPNEVPAKKFTKKVIPGTDNEPRTGVPDLDRIPRVQMPGGETGSMTGMLSSDVEVETLAPIDGTE